jgi:hypothetical protein
MLVRSFISRYFHEILLRGTNEIEYNMHRIGEKLICIVVPVENNGRDGLLEIQKSGWELNIKLYLTETGLVIFGITGVKWLRMCSNGDILSMRNTEGCKLPV